MLATPASAVRVDVFDLDALQIKDSKGSAVHNIPGIMKEFMRLCIRWKSANVWSQTTNLLYKLEQTLRSMKAMNS